MIARCKPNANGDRIGLAQCGFGKWKLLRAGITFEQPRGK